MEVKSCLMAGCGVMLVAGLLLQFCYSQKDTGCQYLKVERLSEWKPIEVFESDEERSAAERILRYTSAHRYTAENGAYDILILIWDSGGDKMRDIVLHNPVACWPQTGWKVLPTTPRNSIGSHWRGSPPIRCAFADSRGRSLSTVFWRTSGGESVATWRVDNGEIAGIGLHAGLFDAVTSRNKQQVFIRISTTGIIEEEALTRIATHFYDSFGPR